MLFWLTQLLPYFVFAIYQISTRSSGPPAPHSQIPILQESTPEKILELDPLACIKPSVRYNHQDPWILLSPKLFRGKFNFLPTYQLNIKPPVTPKPMPASLPDLPTDHISKLFGIVSITLAGVIGTIILAASLWSWVGKSMTYLIKLALILWWALPAKPAACAFLKTTGWRPKVGCLTIQEKPKLLKDYRNIFKHSISLMGSKTSPSSKLGGQRAAWGPPAPQNQSYGLQGSTLSCIQKEALLSVK
ncbi:hypothetical protein DSO57_1007341 [Entomophthora muscae]|uniref:Uncharacterized protein n=1 Tax=Entomophthora muscae TaxID=34485 RepID=A0ACC2S9C0_9FUNG|nr:hypothetical protein DSO57_1007341 [Entomophthora muscae]